MGIVFHAKNWSKNQILYSHVFVKFPLQRNTNLDTCVKANPFMIPAEFANRVDDLIQLTERHSVHLLVELIEILADLFIVVGVVFVEAFV